MGRVTAITYEFLPGQIFTDPYLTEPAGRDGEGRKSRPTWVVVAFRSAKDGLTHLALLAVTMQPPRSGCAALQIPDTGARRAGLNNLRC